MSINDDKRRAKRYYFKALLQLADASEFSNVELESINISSGGIFFRSSRNLELDTKLNLVFSLPEVETPIEAECNVIHNLETIPGKQYFIGVQFSQLAGISSSGLEEYLAKNYE